MTEEITPCKLRIRLLGEFQLLSGNQSVMGLNADRPQSLLSYLLLHRNAPQSRQHLAFLLWPDSSESQARTNLRNLLFTIRRLLPHADTFIATDAITIQWRPDAPYDLDVARFEEALTAAKQADDPALVQDCLTTAVSLYAGELLPGNYDDWIIPVRESLLRQYGEALSRLVTLLEGKGEYRTAVRYSQQLLQLDPFDEAAAVQLMRLQALSGDRAGIRRSYQSLVTTLQRELGIAPAATTQNAYAQLLSMEPAQPAEEAAVALPSMRPRSLPLPPTPFVGRETELAELAQYLADPDCRLLTIVGLGGMGKSRLALQTAVAHQTIFSAGVAFVRLAGLQTAELLIPAIADELQFHFSGSAEPHFQLFNFLQQKEMLIVLDNFEHLLEGAEMLAALLTATPQVKLLVTSRQRLSLHGEWVYEIEGLPIPEVGNEIDLAQNSAITLFQQSARRVSNHFAPTGLELADIVRICRLVDGMPLAIELAASWVRLFTCAEIAAEIEQNLGFLSIATRNMPERHHNVQAIFDHSWRMLSAEEQGVLARLSLFRGGFTRQAAEQVAGATLPLLSALVDRSLVRRGRAKRYHLHELIRQYAAAMLKQDAQHEYNTLISYRAYYLDLLQTRDKALRSHCQKEALLELTQDVDNLRAAWESAAVDCEVALIGRSAFPLWYFLNLRDALHEGEIAFARAAAEMQARLGQSKQEDTDPERERLAGVVGELLSHQAQFTFRQGRIAEAADLYQASLALLRPLAEPAALAQTLTYSGVVNWIAGKFDEACLYLNESVSVLSLVDDEWRKVQSHTFLGMVAHAQGDYDAAYDHLSDSLATARALGDPRLMSLVLGQLGRTAQALGRSGEVLVLLQECLQLTTETGDHLGLGITLEQMAVATQANGDQQEARRLLQESIKEFRDIGDMWFLAHALNLEGNMALAAGKCDKAEESFKEAARIAFTNQSPPNFLDAMVGLAALNSEQGQDEKALETALFVLGHPAATQAAKGHAEALRQRLESELPDLPVKAVPTLGQEELMSFMFEKVVA